MKKGLKRRRAAEAEPANLKRFKLMIESYTKEHSEQLEGIHGSPRNPVTSLRPGKQDKPSGMGPKSRKAKRKEERQLKKARKHAFKQHKPLPTLESKQEEAKEAAERSRKSEKAKEKKKKQRQKTKERKKKKKQTVQEAETEDDTRRQGLEEANKVEDKMIKQLEKQLKMTRRKSKNLPQAFISDGLDYIIDAVDAKKISGIYGDEDKEDVFGMGDDDSDVSADGDDSEMSSGEGEEDIVGGEGLENKPEEDTSGPNKTDSDDGLQKVELPSTRTTKSTKSMLGEKTGKKAVQFKKLEKKKNKVFSNVLTVQQDKVQTDSGSEEEGAEEEEESGSSNEEGVTGEESGYDDEGESEEDDEEHIYDSEDENNDDDEGGNDDDDGVLERKTSKQTKSKYKEDIYGRLRDEHGNIVTEKAASGGAYVPPGKRLAVAGSDDKKKIKLERMKKQLKGLVNRLSEANLQPISSQIEEFFRSHSRAEVSEVLADIILAVCVGPTIVPDRLIMEHAMLLAILHGNVGSEIGALFLQTVAQQFHTLSQLPNYGTRKEMDNLLVLLCHMYNFKIIHSMLIFDILKKLADNFEERDIELLLVVLKNVGFTLRKDDPNALKDLIVRIQAKAGTVDTTQLQDQSRVKFMLETLLAIRNNNMRKIPNYDPSHCDHLKKLLRNYVRETSTSDMQLRISLEELLTAEDQGRWWLVGSAWSGRDSSITAGSENTTSKASAVVTEVSDKLLEIARKQRMNTDIRRNIFCILMTSEDFVDAFEKLLRLGLKHQQERELIHVIMDVCLQEKAFNPFYAYLTQKFLEYDRRFMMTLQFTLWDRFKELSSFAESQISNMALLLIHLIATKALSLSVFKVIEFSELDKVKVKLMKKVMLGLLIDYPDYLIKEVFQRIMGNPKLHILREGLKLFIQHFLLRNKGKVIQLDGAVREKIAIAEKALAATDTALWL